MAGGPPVTITVTLVDATGEPAQGGGTWQVELYKDRTRVGGAGPGLYETASLGASIALGQEYAPIGAWTKLVLTVIPNRYAPIVVSAELESNGTVYIDDALTTAKISDITAALRVPLLRVRPATGVEPTAPPNVGSPLAGPWLVPVPRSQPKRSRYKALDELSGMGWSTPGGLVLKRLEDRQGDTSPLNSPADPNWGRFTTQSSSPPILTPDLASAGAPVVLEYGEVGADVRLGPAFLVGLWAPKLKSSNTPDSRPLDFVAFIPPKTVLADYPPDAYPYRKAYPYVVAQDSDLPNNLYQPYVRLALKYLTGVLAPYGLVAKQQIILTPVFPHPKNERDPNFGQPFTSRPGLARLTREVAQLLARMQYQSQGPTGTGWWGTEEPVAHRVTTPQPTPPAGRLAVASYSAGAAELTRLLTNTQLANSYPRQFWGVSDQQLALAMTGWIETWCLDLETDSTTVAAADFDNALTRWLGEGPARRFIIGGSGTTGGGHWSVMYPRIHAKSGVTAVPSGGPPAAFVWRGPEAKWLAVFCTNSYLTASTPAAGAWPSFPMSANNPGTRDGQMAHDFMFTITTGLAIAWSQVGA